MLKAVDIDLIGVISVIDDKIHNLKALGVIFLKLNFNK